MEDCIQHHVEYRGGEGLPLSHSALDGRSLFLVVGLEVGILLEVGIRF